MVATRRGAGAVVSEPTPTTQRTRRRTVKVSEQSHPEQTSDSQQDDAEQQNSAPPKPNPHKRETRRSQRRPTDANQPDSTHEADVSDSESCCSVASGVPAIADVQPTPRGRRRTAVREKPPAVEQEASEGESCSSSAPLTRTRRSTRTQKKPESSTSQDKCHSEAESCSSVQSLAKTVESQMSTRSRRRTAAPLEDAEPSEADSCSSPVSTVRRSTRNRKAKPADPIPFSLEQSDSTEASAASGPGRTRGRRGKAKSADEDPVYDSEGCQSGPSLSPKRTTRSRTYIADSDSESVTTAYTSLDSPSSLRGKGTPCSSRTGSASSNRAVPVSRTRSKAKAPSDVTTTDSKESEAVTAQAETAVEMPSQLARATVMEDVEETEEDESNKTVINLEDAKADVTLTLDEEKDVGDRADEVTETVEAVNRPQTGSLVRGVTVSENTESVEENQEETKQAGKVVDATMEESAELVQELQEQSSVKVSGEPEEEKVEEAEVESKMDVDDCNDHHEHSVPPEKCVRMSVEDGKSEVDDEPLTPKVSTSQAVTVTYSDSAGQKTANKEQEPETKADIEEQEPSCSTSAEEPMTSVPRQTTTKKRALTLLDSSEDEDEGDDDGLSAEGCKEDGEEESEDEVRCSDNQPASSGPGDDYGLFVIDTRPGLKHDEKYYINEQEEEDGADPEAVEIDDEFVDEEGDDDEDDEDSNVLFTTRKPALVELSSSIDPGLKVKELGGLYISFDGSKSKSVSNNLKKLKDKRNQDELLKKSVIVPDLEKKDAVPPYNESQHALKRKRKAERAKTTGDGWFNMKAPELTEELRNDLKALQMRSAMDPKRFYKKNDREGFPKYFQVGTVVDSPVDFYHSRIPKKERKRTIVEELLTDAEFRSFNKRKYKEIMAEKAAEAAGKMNKKKHKFNKKK